MDPDLEISQEWRAREVIRVAIDVLRESKEALERGEEFWHVSFVESKTLVAGAEADIDD